MLRKIQVIPAFVLCCLSLLFLLCHPAVVTSAINPNSYKYDVLCDSIIAAAQLCASAHNKNDASGAKKAEEEVQRTFQEAVTLEPNEPQAYMHLATFYTNSHRFDKATELWEKILTILPSDQPATAGQPDVAEHVRGQLKHCRYGKISVARDQVYKHGEGDIHAAVELAKQQLQIYYSPRILFDLATLLTMQSELDPEKYESANNYFHQSQVSSLSASATFQAAMQRQKKRRTNKKPCPKQTRLHPVDKPTSPKLGFTRSIVEGLGLDDSSCYNRKSSSRLYEASSSVMYVNELEDATLSGPDGVITKRRKCTLHAFATSEYPVVGLHANLWMAENWKSNSSFNIYDHSLERKFSPPNPTRSLMVLEVAVTLVGFSTTVYYHWIMNAIPRLVLLLPTLERLPKSKLIVPKVSSQHFIFQTLRMTLPNYNELFQQRIVRYDVGEAPGARMSVGKLVWADWPIVTKQGGRRTHCLTSPSALVSAARWMEGRMESANHREEAEEEEEMHWVEEEENVLLYVGRNGTSTRRLDAEYQLVDRLKRLVAASSVDNVGGRPWRFKTFDDGKNGMLETMKTFSTASLIVGIHGSGMSNVLFSKKGTPVIEIGFTSIAAKHYEHASLALGMEYTFFGLEADVHAMGSTKVQLSAENTNEIVSRVENILMRRSDTEAVNNGGSEDVSTRDSL
jgi:hypothetical protein